MRYFGMPLGMWVLFQRSFRQKLTEVMGIEKSEAAKITEKARRSFQNIIRSLPEFEKEDRFQMNIISCAMLCAFVLNMKERPDVSRLTDYYREAMMTEPMKWFCRKSGKNKFTSNDIAAMKQTASLKAADRNPYSWNMEFLPYPDGSGYEARFTKCGICTLMKELDLQNLIPAMCRLDYAMSEAGGTSEFVRKYTLAGGDSCCDCGYRKKQV